VIAREAAVSDPEVVELLKTKFIPYALDNVEHPNLTPAEKEFLSGFDSGMKACTIGMSAFTADGKKIASGGGFEAKSVRSLIQKALAEFKPETVSATIPPRDEAATASLRRMPEGGRVLYVTWKLLEEFAAEGNATTGNGTYDKVFQRSLGSDRLWIRKDEAEALVAGTFPESLKSRMLRYHVQYVMSKEAKTLDLTLQSGRIEGSVPVGDRKADCLGFVQTKDGKLTGLELLVRGWGRRVEDHGFSACLSVVPKDQPIPTGIFFELADPSDGLAGVIPHRARDTQYLK
jgi:hypothetical protein